MAQTIRGTTDDVPRVAAIDWGQAQTLTAMGVPPVAVAQVGAYNIWVGEPELPVGIRDVGLRAQPNLELLSQLHLDLITITPMYAKLKSRLQQIAPVKSIGVYYNDLPVWRATVLATKALGQAVGHPEAADRLIQRVTQRIDTLADRLSDEVPPLLVVQFQDARHVRVYSSGSLIDATLKRLGLHNAWRGEKSLWGAVLVPIARLADIRDARMVVVEPVPAGVSAALKKSVIWQHLPIVRQHRVVRIPGVWSYGGLPSATRFARLLVDALDPPLGASSADPQENPTS